MYTRRQLAMASLNLGPCPAVPGTLSHAPRLWARFAAGPWTIQQIRRDHYIIAGPEVGLEVTVSSTTTATAIMLVLIHDRMYVNAASQWLPSSATSELRSVLRWLLDALAMAGSLGEYERRMRVHFYL